VSDVILKIENISKSFPGVQALNNVSFPVLRGSIHALIGENGAGKSTLIKILSGASSHDSGAFYINGEKMEFATPLDAIRSGISVVHQEIKLVDTLTVAENIYIGQPPLTKRGTVNWKKLHQDARRLLDSINADINTREVVGKLPIAKQQMVEICKALSHKAEIVIMDEPSATLTDKELTMLFSILNNLKEQGITIIYISHRMEEVFEISDQVTILRDGEHIHTGEIKDLNRQKLISMMVGRELENEYPKEFNPRGEPLLEVRNLCKPGVLKDISLKLYAGEVLCISGLVGCGRTEFARTLFGADNQGDVTGEVIIKGQPAHIRSVKDAMKAGIALIPEDRKRQGLVLLMSVRENITLASIKKVMRKGRILRKLENSSANHYISVLRIVTPDAQREVKYLSGGNQQKVVIAKWLATNADILILDEPTRGIDIGAKAEIYKLLNSFTSQGKGVIMISSEMPEVLGMCDRVIVFREGGISGEFLREDATQEKLLDHAMR